MFLFWIVSVSLLFRVLCISGVRMSWFYRRLIPVLMQGTRNNSMLFPLRLRRGRCCIFYRMFYIGMSFSSPSLVYSSQHWSEHNPDMSCSLWKGFALGYISCIGLSSYGGLSRSVSYSR